MNDNNVFVGETELLQGEYTLKLEPKESELQNCCALDSNDGIVVLDLQITEELRLEGVARDIIRFTQQTRKEINLDVVDKIEIVLLTGNNLVLGAVEEWKDFISEQTLANNIIAAQEAHDDNYMTKKEFEIESSEVIKISLLIRKS